MEDFKNLKVIARGSASELEYHLLLAKDLCFLEEVNYKDLQGRTQEIQRMLASLSASVRNAMAS